MVQKLEQCGATDTLPNFSTFETEAVLLANISIH